MPLTDKQWSVDGLVMGPGTPYQVLTSTNPFRRQARAEATAGRAWGHGGWSGAEWAAEAVVSWRILVEGATRDYAAWWDARQELARVFAPVGDSGRDVEMRWSAGGVEYLMFGRPRMLESTTDLEESGRSVEQAAFVALDPLIYDGTDLAPVSFGLPKWEGGLTVPFTVPFTVPGVAVDGFAQVVNEGTAEHGMRVRIDGPVSEPRLSVARPDGSTQTLRLRFDLSAGQWVEVDTAARTVLLNGLPQASRRGQVQGVFPLLPPGESTVRFRASEDNDVALLTVFPPFSAWW